MDSSRTKTISTNLDDKVQTSSRENPLYKVRIPVKYRDRETRVDQVPSVDNPPQVYDITIFVEGAKNPLFKIIATNIDNAQEEFEIEIAGQKKIKRVMQSFKHEYLKIVSNLRVMGDVMVLLNPFRKQDPDSNMQEPPRIKNRSPDLSIQK